MASAPLPETETRRAERHGPTGHHEHDPTTNAVAMVAVTGTVVGGLGIVAALLPGLWFVAWPLGLIALLMGGPVSRRDVATPRQRTARVAVVLGVIALVLGLVNLGISLDWFDYFNG